MSALLTIAECESLEDALDGGRMYDDVPTVVADILAAHLAAQREQIAQAIEGSIAAHREHGHRQIVAAMADLPRLIRDEEFR